MRCAAQRGDGARALQVLPFFRDLESLPDRPDIDTLRKVFSWYDDGFLKGVDVETDPAAAWRACASTPSPPRHPAEGPVPPPLHSPFPRIRSFVCAVLSAASSN